MKNNHFCKVLLGMFLIIGLNTSGLALTNADLTKVIEQRAESLVTVKFILNISMGSVANRDQETENEMSCVMVSSDGLVMCSNNKLSGYMDMISQMTGGAGLGISAIPKELKVVIGADQNTYDAEIVTKDSELDIVWIKIKNPEAVKFTFVNFSADKETVLGDEIIVLRRMGNYFGRQIVASTASIGGITSKPRKLYVPDIMFSNGGGVPVFASNGDAIGFMITQFPESHGGASSMMSMISGNFQDGLSGLILPAAEVSSATKRAMQQHK